MKVSTVALAVVLLLAGGCPRQEQDVTRNAPSKTTTTPVPPATASDDRTALNPVAAPQKELPSSRMPAAATPEIPIELTEYSIKVPPTIPAGHQTLSVVNSGKEAHGLAIEGAGHQYKLPEPLHSGDRGTLVVELRPGSYTVYCPVDNHKGKGMLTTVVVR